MWAGRGAILIEHVVATSVLAVVVIGVLSLLSVGYLSTVIARDLSLATNLAQRKLEEVRAAGCEAAASIPRQPVDARAPQGYEWEVEVLEQSPGLKEVKATVYWKVRGRQRSLNLVTLMRAAR